jgi:hypothetical protein
VAVLAVAVASVDDANEAEELAATVDESERAAAVAA